MTACSGNAVQTVIPQPASSPISPAALPGTAIPSPFDSQPTVPAPGAEILPPSTQPSSIGAPVAGVSAFPDPTGYTWRLVAQGLEKPVGITGAEDGSGRLFVIEQPGRIRTLKDGALQTDPFLDITGRVGSQGFEQGLLGLAFHPHFADNSIFFVNYTDLKGNTIIARFPVDNENPGLALADQETRLLEISQPFANHNGGGLAFGPDGYLYLGLGDGGSAGDPQGNGQSTGSLLGKILRLDVDSENPYAIPADNPFIDKGGLQEIWALGLRNPWRFSFDSLTGDLYIADVGQNQWEEINVLPAGSPGGLNFGWNIYEGSHPFSSQASPPDSLIFPVFEYNHDQGCSVTGGVVYRGRALPEFSGIYLYGDYCSGSIWGLLQTPQGTWINTVLFEGMGQITSFGMDDQQEIYLVLHSGEVFRLEAK